MRILIWFRIQVCKEQRDPQKSKEIYCFWSAGCSLVRAEVFYRNFDKVLWRFCPTLNFLLEFPLRKGLCCWYVFIIKTIHPFAKFEKCKFYIGGARNFFFLTIPINLNCSAVSWKQCCGSALKSGFNVLGYFGSGCGSGSRILMKKNVEKFTPKKN